MAFNLGGGGQITFRSKYSSLEFDRLKQTSFLGPLITWDFGSQLGSVKFRCTVMMAFTSAV